MKRLILKFKWIIITALGLVLSFVVNGRRPPVPDQSDAIQQARQAVINEIRKRMEAEADAEKTAALNSDLDDWIESELGKG